MLKEVKACPISPLRSGGVRVVRLRPTSQLWSLFGCRVGARFTVFVDYSCLIKKKTTLVATCKKEFLQLHLVPAPWHLERTGFKQEHKPSLRSKRFQLSHCVKVGARAKKWEKEEGKEWRENSYAQAPRFWKTFLDISRVGSFVDWQLVNTAASNFNNLL